MLVCQLIVSFTKGVFTPFYNYGMYSSVIKIKEEYPILEIYSDGKLIDYTGYTIYEYDRIINGYEHVANTNFNGDFFDNRINPLMSLLGIQLTGDRFVMNNTPSEQNKRMKAWKNMTEHILKTKIDSFGIKNYKWNGKLFTRM